MSDTCQFYICFARKDLDKFNEVLEDEMWRGVWWNDNLNDDDDDEIDAVVYEAEKGWNNQIRELAKAKLTFYGSHSAGGDYGPMVFVCIKGDFVECSSDIDGFPVVSVGYDGFVEHQMEQAMKYWLFMNKLGKVS